MWNFKCLPVQWNAVFLFHVLCCYLVSLFWTIFWLGSECQLTFHLVQQNDLQYHNPLLCTVLEFWKQTSLHSDPASGSERIFLDCFMQVAARFAASISYVKLKTILLPSLLLQGIVCISYSNSFFSILSLIQLQVHKLLFFQTAPTNVQEQKGNTRKMNSCRFFCYINISQNILQVNCTFFV